MTINLPRLSICFVVAALAASGPAAAQPPAQAPGESDAPAASSAPAAPASRIAGIPSPRDYVIGPDDVLSVVFWRDKDMSAEVVVRPDGKITLPLINEIDAAGLTPQQLRDRVEKAAQQFVSDATATVVLKQINSRKVFVTGSVEHPGSYPLNTPTTVLQIIATAGGLKEYADSKHIVVMRNEGKVQASYYFDYKSVTTHKKLQQNILLLPGDTVVVP
jgi:polysaccharide export outer membrane protein